VLETPKSREFLTASHFAKSRHDYAPVTFVCKQENLSARLSHLFPRTPAIFHIFTAFCYGTHPFFPVLQVPISYSASDVPKCPAI
jgi:hypothetical protein